MGDRLIKKRKLIERGISIMILIIIANSIFVEREDCYNKCFSVYLLLELIAVLSVGVAMTVYKTEFKKIRIDGLAILFWISFSLYTLASDYLVDKTYRFAGISVFFILFIVGYISINDRLSCFINSFVRAVQLFLLFLILISFFFPKQTSITGRYSGPIENPSVYALYLCAIWAVLLGCLEEHIENKRSRAKLIMTICEMVFTIVLMVLSQSLTPTIALAAVTFLWFFRIVAKRKGAKPAMLRFSLIGAVLILSIIGLVILIRSESLGGDSRLIQKMQATDISEFLSGRDFYWRRYLREMNLFGHSKRPFLWDHRILPHNALIGMMYWYGVPCVIPYILMMMMAIEKSYRFADTSVPYAAVPFYSIVSFVIMSMADNVEQPFVWLPWIACYLMMAPILIMPIEEIEALKSANADINTEESEQI